MGRDDDAEFLGASPDTLLRLVAQASPDYITLVDRERRIRWLNRPADGLTHDDVVGRLIDDFIVATDLQTTIEAVDRCFATGEQQHHVMHFTADDREQWADSRVVPLPGRGDLVMITATDTTAQHLAERELRATMAMHEQAQEAASMGSWSYDIDSDVIVFSTQLKRMLGLPDHFNAQQSSIAEMIDEADRARVLTFIEAAIESGGQWRIDHTLKKADGERVEAIGFGQLLVEDGRRYLRGGTIDVSELRTRERDLQRTLDLLERAEESVGMGSFTVDVGTGDMVWSNQLKRLIGVPPDYEPTVQSVIERIPDKDREEMAAKIREILASEGRWFIDEHDLFVDDGRTMRVQVFGQTERVQDRFHAQGVMVNVTHLHDRELELEHALELIDHAEEMLRMGRWWLDVRRGEADWSPQLRKLLSMPEHEAVSERTVLNHVPTSDRERVKGIIEEQVVTPGRWSVEHDFLTHDDRNVRILAFGRTIIDDARHIVRGATVDVTELRRREQLLSEALEEKDLLLRELRHRSKNNLQRLLSFIRLQQMAESSPESSLQDLEIRVLAMSSVHDHLLPAVKGERVELQAYLAALSRELAGRHNSSFVVSVNEDCGTQTALSVDRAMLCGLIVAEVTQRLLRAAPPTGRHLEVAIRDGDAQCHVCVTATPLAEPPEAPGGGQALSDQLAEALVDQLGGALVLSTEEGTAELSFALED